MNRLLKLSSGAAMPGATSPAGRPISMARLLLLSSGTTTRTPPPAGRPISMARLLLLSSSAASTLVVPTVPVLFTNELANFLRASLINPSPLKLPQQATAYPQMRFTLIDGDEDLLANGPCGQAWRRYQIDCMSPTYSDAETLAERLRLLLRTFTGPMGRVVVTNVVRHQVLGKIDPPANGGDSSAMSRFISDFSFWFYQ